MAGSVRASGARPWVVAVVLVLGAAVAWAALSNRGAPGPEVAAVTGTPLPAPTPSPAGDPGACRTLDELEAPVANAPATDAAFPWDQDDPIVLPGYSLDEIRSGGPPPDGILPIDDPCFDAVPAADAWLEPDSPLLVVEHEGQVRAYPLSILTQHEIVNDVVAGTPLLVTYCPLCNSALVFERKLDGAVFDFGTSGRLYQSNLVMYDRQTRSLWTQFLGRGIVGERAGDMLARLPSSLLGWEDVRSLHPDVLVLSPSTFPDRDYGRNPYPGLEDQGSFFRDPSSEDDRLPPATRVVGLGVDRDPVAVVTDELRDARVLAVEVAGRPVTLWWAPGQASAIDAVNVDDGRDVGSVVAFEAALPDGTTLAFEPGADDDVVVEATTGSRFDLRGVALDGPLEGTHLVPVVRDDTFWFVWFSFQPDTRILPAT